VISNTALVFAAGLGTRMGDLTKDRPKALVELGGKALIDYMLDYLRGGGVEHFVVNMHHHGDKIAAHFKTNRDHSVTLSDERDMLLDTGGGLMKALPLLPSDTPFFVANADVIFKDASGGPHGLQQLDNHWDDEKMDCLLLLTPKALAKGHKGAGDFFLEEDGRVRPRGDAPSAPYIFTGLRLFHPRLAQGYDIEAFSFLSFFNKALANGRLYGVPYEGRWMDVGTREALMEARDLV
jgi:MurNAc alpha-1-phosphate uridylyltransferase